MSDLDFQHPQTLQRPSHGMAQKSHHVRKLILRHTCPVKTQISWHISAVWSESSKAPKGYPKIWVFLRENGKTDQIMQMHRGLSETLIVHMSLSDKVHLSLIRLNVQANLTLHWEHTSEDTFSHTAAQIRIASYCNIKWADHKIKPSCNNKFTAQDEVRTNVNLQIHAVCQEQLFHICSQQFNPYPSESRCPVHF